MASLPSKQTDGVLIGMGMATDFLQRFVFESLDIRGRFVCLTQAWQHMSAGRNYPPAVLELLGQSAAMATLLGATTKANTRVSLQVRGNGPVPLLVADCTAERQIRGMAQHAPSAHGTARTLLGDGRIALTVEDLGTGQHYQSLVPITGEHLPEIFGHYLDQSEQLATFLLLQADPLASCGLLLEKLPTAQLRDADGWDRITHLASTLTLAESQSMRPHDLLVRLFPEELLRVFPLETVHYHCPYDIEKVRRMLRSLGRAEVESILAEKGEVLVRDDLCHHEYRFDAAAAAALFTEEDATKPSDTR